MTDLNCRYADFYHGYFSPRSHCLLTKWLWELDWKIIVIRSFTRIYIPYHILQYRMELSPTLMWQWFIEKMHWYIFHSYCIRYMYIGTPHIPAKIYRKTWVGIDYECDRVTVHQLLAYALPFQISVCVCAYRTSVDHNRQWLGQIVTNVC